MANAKDTNETHLYLVDGVTTQKRVRECYQMPYPSKQMPHLLKKDAAIERVAWLVVVGLLFAAIRVAGTL